VIEAIMSEIPAILYHGTGYDRLESIMKEGLKPTTGETLTKYTKSMGYSIPAIGNVHMTTKKSIAQFFAIAGHNRTSANVLLKISTKGLDEDKFCIEPIFNESKAEFKYMGKIPPENIESIEEVIPIKSTWHIDSKPHTREQIYGNICQ
jgi:hypothetical protein